MKQQYTKPEINCESLIRGDVLSTSIAAVQKSEKDNTSFSIRSLLQSTNEDIFGI